MSEFYLIPRILDMSVSKLWEEAKYEWELYKIIRLEGDYETCLCEHYPIKDLCHIKNKLNGKTAIVGNCCIKKFVNVDNTSNIINAIKDGRININVIEFALKKRIINNRQYMFLRSVWRKRKMSEKDDMLLGLLTEKIMMNIIERR